MRQLNYPLSSIPYPLPLLKNYQRQRMDTKKIQKNKKIFYQQPYLIVYIVVVQGD